MNISEYLMSHRDGSESYPIAPRIVCEDGFSLSVQATRGAYSTPRSNTGPWSEVEVGFPSSKPDFIMPFAEQSEKPTKTVYGYVPIELVEQLIALHGGYKVQP